MENILESLKTEIQGHNERFWIEQLYKDYDDICFQFGVKLRQPVICISDATSFWGVWDSSTRTISISRELIRQKSWERVLGILKHEMAHQFADEVLKSDKAHGEDFRISCDVLGVPPEFRRSSIPSSDPLHTWQQNDRSTDSDPVLRKVEKLLSLAQSANENEAYLAMERVQNLFAKYNLERAQLGTKGNYVHLIIDTQKKRIERSTLVVTSILAEFYFVRVIYASQFDATHCDSFKTIEILGTRENVTMAEYVFHFLHNTISALWNQYKRRSGVTSSSRLSYQIGLLTGFREKLENISLKETGNPKTNALIKHMDKQLDEYVGSVYPKIGSKKNGSGKVESSSFHAGKTDGGKIVIHKGVTHQKGKSTALLL